MRTEMTRYSKNPDKANRKNTLVTIQEGDTIFFGIARCNMSAGDRFLKARGRTAAKARAIRASLDCRATEAGQFVVHTNGLRGSCPVVRIHELLAYFNDIDQTMLENSRK